MKEKKTCFCTRSSILNAVKYNNKNNLKWIVTNFKRKYNSVNGKGE